MIAALSKASLITGKEEYQAAVNAYEFIMVNLTDDGGKLKSDGGRMKAHLRSA